MAKPGMRMHKASGELVPASIPNDELDAIWRAFEKYDVDKSKSIDAGELINLSTDLGDPISDEEAKALIETHDCVEKDGKLSFSEFIGYWCEEE